MASRPTPTVPTEFLHLTTPGAQVLARAALLRAPEARHAAWKQWRDAVQLDDLSYQEMRILPALTGQLGRWLAGDSGAGRLHGIVRRCWTEDQVALSELKSAATTVEQSGCRPVLISGSASVAVLNAAGGPRRPISDLRLLVPRVHVPEAVRALEQADWRLSGKLPEGDLFDWVAMVNMSRNGVSLMVQWRMLPLHGELAATCEAEFLRNSQIVEQRGSRLRTLGLEQLMLAVLCDRFEFDKDPFPWELEFNLLPWQQADWNEWTRLAKLLAPEAFERLDSLRQWGLRVPIVTLPAAPVIAAPPPVITPVAPSFLERNYRRWRRQMAIVRRDCKNALQSWNAAR